ncbi:MAG TPA: flagellar hook-basal body complex protein FliE, partial [Rhodospirillales bacterium]|nr:flagellar hook-basal body complex protein FliE [Rhodospirillales bacterium]
MPNPIDSYGKALAAYAKAAGGGAAAAPTEAGGGSPFANMLKQVAGDAVAAGRSAEAASAGAAVGHGDLSRVVTAVAEAEMT